MFQKHFFAKNNKYIMSKILTVISMLLKLKNKFVVERIIFIYITFNKIFWQKWHGENAVL